MSRARERARELAVVCRGIAGVIKDGIVSRGDADILHGIAVYLDDQAEREETAPQTDEAVDEDEQPVSEAPKTERPIETLLKLAEKRLDCCVRVEFHIGADDNDPVVCELIGGYSNESTTLVSFVAGTAERAAEGALRKFRGDAS